MALTQNRWGKALAIGTTAIAVTAMATACSGKSKGGGGGGGAGTRGPITFVQGKDNTNSVGPTAQMWNKGHPNEKVTIKQQSDSADDQHQDLVQNFQAKSSNYDVTSVDVIWTAEFAAKGWLQPLTGQYKLDTSNLLPAPVKAATYAGTLYAGPTSSDGGMLYYRKDLIGTHATFTWDQINSICAQKKAKHCYDGQFAKYEGLVCNAAEWINAAGGIFVKEDGKTPDVNTAQAKTGLTALVSMFQKGYISKDNLGWKEDLSLQDFENGNAVFLRNWPYAVSLLNTDAKSKVKGKYGLAPLPGPSGTGASTLGGHNMAISAYSKHKATALDFIKFMESEQMQKFGITQSSNAPVIASLYSDPTLTPKFPYLPVLLKSIQTAVPRPVTPFYPAVTEAIQTNVYAALQGQKSVDSALSDLQKALAVATGS
jgi:multiple sugar transport system substrate-binding protein